MRFLKYFFLTMSIAFMVPAAAVADEIYSVWHGMGLQNSGSSWSMQLDLRHQPPTVIYPSLKCGATWEKVGQGSGYIEYYERVTSNRNACIDGYVRVFMLDTRRLAFEFSSKRGARPLARAVLFPGAYKSGRDKSLAAETRRFIKSDQRFALAPSVSNQDALALLMLGLIGKGIAAGADALRNNSSGAGASSIAPKPAQEVENKPRGVSMDGDGWVSVDGRTLGRVSFSYGKYRITCSSGYNSGWGTGSAWGSSFEIEARNRDQAAGVLLQACKR